MVQQQQPLMTATTCSCIKRTIIATLYLSFVEFLHFDSQIQDCRELSTIQGTSLAPTTGYKVLLAPTSRRSKQNSQMATSRKKQKRSSESTERNPRRRKKTEEEEE
jgi:hypothetical protein